jgi:translation initiation factor 1 (eIF-1/SUI1)
MRGLKIIIVLMTSVTICYSQTVTSTIIKFDEFTIEFENLAPFDDKQLRKTFTTDMEFAVDLGETLESSRIKIQTDNWDKIEVEQRLETSVTIMNEGPHCDLVDWKHYTTDWTKLKEINKLTYTALSYKNGEITKFPDVDMKELREAVKKKCGQGWADLIKETKTPYDYPCDVGVSRFYVKVIGTDKVTGKRIQRIITIRIPMGC